MTLNQTKLWEVIGELIRASRALDDLIHDKAFADTVGRHSSLYEDLTRSQVLLEGHIRVWHEMLKEKLEEQASRNELPF